MSFGLKIYDESGNTRLDVADRQIRFVGFYSGTVNASSPVTISVPGLKSDGTWGLNEISAVTSCDISISNDELNVTTAVTTNIGYKVQVFKI